MSDKYSSDLGLRSDRRCLCLPSVVAFMRRRWGFTGGTTSTGSASARSTAPRACALVTLRSTSRTAAGSVCASPARHEARERTVHQERYNPLKVGYQPQDPSAKVQQDFGVRSVTWLA
jgi:hypothetical protein